MKKDPNYKSVLSNYTPVLINILFLGLSKVNESCDPDIIEETEEWNVSLSSGCALEYLALIMKEEIMESVINFSFPKLASGNWIDRYVGNLALGAIVEGPNPEFFKTAMA